MSLFDCTELSDSELHAACQDAGRQRHRANFRVCALLLAAEERGLDATFGYASIHEYGERVFGVKRRAVKDRLRVAHRLVELPAIAARFEAGEVGYAVVRELVRPATVDNEAVWLDEAEGRTGTEMQRLVRGLERGAAPGDAPVVEEDELITTTLHVSPEAFALLQQARTDAVQRAGESLDDPAFATELALALLNGGGERDHGKAAFQIAIGVDPVHRGARLKAGPDSLPISGAVLEMARCDAVHIGRVDGPGRAARASQTVPPRVRRQVVARHDGCCGVPGCFLAAFVHIHHVDLVSEGGQHDPERMIPLCTRHHLAVHRGALEIRGRFSTGFEFLHADGRPYGSPTADAAAARLFADAFEALTSMGFKEKDARPLLDAVRSQVAPGGAVRPFVAR